MMMMKMDLYRHQGEASTLWKDHREYRDTGSLVNSTKKGHPEASIVKDFSACSSRTVNTQLLLIRLQGESHFKVYREVLARSKGWADCSVHHQDLVFVAKLCCLLPEPRPLPFHLQDVALVPLPVDIL